MASTLTKALPDGEARPDGGAARTLLLVDDEDNVLRALRRVFRRGGWRIDTASTGEEALAAMEAHPADVIVSDYLMPRVTGVELLRQIKERWPDTQRIMLTGQADQTAVREAINRSEVFRFVNKPWDDDELLLTVGSAFEAAGLVRENRRLLKLALEKNDQLAALNASLEEKVRERTALLSQSKREWEATFDALDTPTAIVDQKHRVRRANLAWIAGAGLPPPEAVQLPCFKGSFGRDAPCPDCPLPAALARGQREERVITLGSHTVVVTAHPWPGGSEPWAVLTYRDVTEERRNAAWRVRTERLAAVGRLAGGVAHEINNPLSGVLAFTQILRREPGRSGEEEESLRLIEESALRCKHIVESLLRFAGSPGASTLQPVDLRRVAEDTTTLFRAQIKQRPRAKLTLDLGDASPAGVVGDPPALGQALLDLLHHRLRALPAEGGTLGLSLGADAEVAFWRLTDTAPSLDPATIDRLGDPEVADASGLGLAFRIVEDHHGRIDVAPLPEGGNSFTVRLPFTEPP